MRAYLGLLISLAMLTVFGASSWLLEFSSELTALGDSSGPADWVRVLRAIGLWALMQGVGSFCFIMVVFVGHNQEANWSAEKGQIRDWGAWQLAATSDIHVPCGLRGVPLCGMMLFFLHEQTLHHLFPMIDHSRLHSLRPLVAEVAERFSLELRPPQSYAKMWLGMMATVAGVSGVKEA